MSTKAEHTAQWTAEPYDDGDGWFLMDADGNDIVMPEMMDEATAKRIVRAVNSHAELLEACKLAAASLNAMGANNATARIVLNAITKAEGRK